MKFNHFLKECQEKGVFKYLSIYIVSSWVFLQVIAVISEPLKFPKTTITYTLLILLIGLPFYIFLLWKYHFRPLHTKEVSKRQQESDLSRASSKTAIEIDPESDTVGTAQQFDKSFRRAYFIGLGIICAIAISAAGLIVRTSFSAKEIPTVTNSFLKSGVSDKIAIFGFDNNTSDKKLDIVGKMAVDWIMHGITENRIAQVISPKIINDYTKVLKASIVPGGNDNTVTDYLKPSKIIIGNFYLQKGRLLFQSSIMDESMGKTLVSFKPVGCDAGSPLDCIEALKQRILGFLVTEEKPLEKLQESPPNFEAYQNLLKAKGNYGNKEERLHFINASIAADSTYFEAKVNRLAYYYNSGEFKVCDSLLTILLKESSTNKRQSNLLKMYESLLQGNNRNTYIYLKREYEIYPFDLETNSSTMTVAQQFVNRPEDVTAIFNEISMEDMDLMDCLHCKFRYYIKALSEIEMGNPDSAIAMLTSFAKTKDDRILKEVLIRAYIRSGKSSKKVEGLMSTFSRVVSPLQLRELNLSTGKEFLLMEEDGLANRYFDQLITSLRDGATDEKNLQLLGSAHLYKKEFKKAALVLEKLLALDLKGKTNDYSDLAIAYHLDKRQDMAESILKKMDTDRGDYDYGQVDYAMARYYAAIDENKMAIEYLYKAVAAGKRYGPDSYQNDVFLKRIIGTPDFDEILNFWR